VSNIPVNMHKIYLTANHENLVVKSSDLYRFKRPGPWDVILSFLLIHQPEERTVEL